MTDGARWRRMPSGEHTIETDGVSVWVTSDKGLVACFAQFRCAVDGVELSANPLIAMWSQFRELLRTRHNVEVPQNYMPVWLLKREFATTVM